MARLSCFTWPPSSASVVTVTDEDPRDQARLRVVPTWCEVGPVYTIKDVAEACGLPQPVIAQVVPRTWTDAGWMYTAAQIGEAIDIAHELRRSAGVTEPPRSSAGG